MNWRCRIEDSYECHLDAERYQIWKNWQLNVLVANLFWMYVLFLDHAGSTSRQVERFQEKAVKELRAYVTQTWNEVAEERFPRLLLRLPPLRSLQPGLMEELFFAALIGTVHIDSVIPYILRMDSTEYNGQFGTGNSHWRSWREDDDEEAASKLSVSWTWIKRMCVLMIGGAIQSSPRG